MSFKPTIDDFSTLETANKYKKTQSDAISQIDPDLLAQYLTTIQQDGYIIIPDVLRKQELDNIRAAIAPLLDRTGRNFFEVEHPLILALLDSLFKPGYLLSQLQVINILAGEKQQPIHTDDALYAIPRPRPPLGAATVWAIDDFNAKNGGTVVLPGSHHWGEEHPTKEQLKQQINCEMKAGSVVFFLGTLWHGGGANHSNSSRLAVTAQYCEGFCRTQENFSLSIPKERVAMCSENIKRLLGYSIYGPLMGMVDGKHPKRLLEEFDTPT